jgi:hypothetical protein
MLTHYYCFDKTQCHKNGKSNKKIMGGKYEYIVPLKELLLDMLMKVKACIIILNGYIKIIMW